MIRLLVLLCFFFMEGESFILENSYSNAHQKAVQENKILMVYLTKKYSAACNKELFKIINSKKVSSLIEKCAVFVIVYQKQKESFPIEMLYTVQYPTLFFLDENELFRCKALRGHMKPSDIAGCLKQK
ncbi:thioredoxin family protein [Sulfurimonas sp. ST-27]|uniref:thioredoxin family protein n=1 Tax=Sulfurimonas sp. ST-27 TaxID=3400152 RepID=UPI003AB1603A